MTITISEDFRVAPGEVYEDNEIVFDFAGDAPLHFVNQGRIEATDASAAAVGINARNPYATISNQGTILVERAGIGFGIRGDESLAEVTNLGTIDVQADTAYGLYTYASGAVFDNRAIVTVSGLTAYGVVLGLGGVFSNSGSITVSGDGAYGVVFGNVVQGSFHNRGLIQATAYDGVSVGIGLTGGDIGRPTAPTLTNAGTIFADIAIRSAAGTVQNGWTGVHDYILNSGEIFGRIMLREGDDTFVNTGIVRSQIDMGSGNDTVDLRVGQSFGAVYLGEGDDVAWLGDGADRVDGGAGKDVIHGGGGDDHIDGGAGADVLSGGEGDDTYYVDNTGDRVLEVAGEGVDTIISSVSFTLRGDVENLNLTGSAVTARGNDLDNTLGGNDRDNFLRGGAGADRMYGGAGDDRYEVDNVGDQVMEAQSSGRDWVYSSISYVLPTNVEALTLTGEDWINATGNSKGNAIYGNAGRNIITGGRGSDVMTGKAGSDTFVFTSIADSTLGDSDRITDLNDKSDKLDFRQIDGDVNTAGVQGFTIVDAFTGHAGELVLSYDASTDITSLTVDVNGDGVADMLVRLNGEHESFDRFLFGGG